MHTYYKGYALFLKGESFMICSFSSLRNKEVVNMRTGLKIGYVDDIEMDTQGSEYSFTDRLWQTKGFRYHGQR